MFVRNGQLLGSLIAEDKPKVAKKTAEKAETKTDDESAKSDTKTDDESAKSDTKSGTKK